MIATDVDLMFFKRKCFEFGLERLCDFYVCSAHCSASSLGAPETARRQMQTMWEGGQQLGNYLMFACYNLCCWGFPRFIEWYSELTILIDIVIFILLI